MSSDERIKVAKRLREYSNDSLKDGSLLRELPEGAIRMMSRISGVKLGDASVALGRTSRCLDTALREADATRARGTGRPCGPKAETLAAVARVMGFRLALVGHGRVIEVVPGDGLARGGRR